jgi:NhaP-type Na+/H+ or K+/H+ antiporter
LLVAVIALFGSLVFAAIVACEMGGSWGLVGLLIAFIFLMPQIRRLLERMFPPKEKTRSE